MNANDQAMLEKVKITWWVKPYNETLPWMVVLGNNPYDDAQWLVWNPETPGDDSVEYHDKASVIAIHRPTDDPQMATAYLMGEPETVTLEQSAKMVTPDWTWHSRRGEGWIQNNAADYLLYADFIRSPGGNVYKIEG